MRPELDPKGGSLLDRFGKQVLRIRLLDDDLGSYQHRPPGFSMVCEQSFHGDHDEVWIVVRSSNGVELSRWNVRAVAEIVWHI